MCIFFFNDTKREKFLKLIIGDHWCTSLANESTILSKRYLNKKLYMTKLIATAEATRFTNERTDSHDTNSTLCTCTWLINPFATPKQEITRCILIKRNLHAMKSTIVWMNDRESFAKNNSKVSLNGTTIRKH